MPEEAKIVQDTFNFFECTVTQHGTVKYIRETYGVNWCNSTFRRMLHEKLYTGIYDRGGRINESFCPAIITHEQFEHVQKLTRKNARSSPSGRVYIFMSILSCNECSHKLVGHKTWESYYYRCNQHYHRGRCSHNHSVRESILEAWLFSTSGRRNWPVPAWMGSVSRRPETRHHIQ